MEAILSRDSLHAALTITKRTAERRNTIPILTTVLIEGLGDKIAVTATDLDQYSRVLFPCEPGASGVIALPAHTLFDLVKGMPKGAEIIVTDDEEENTASLLTGHASLKVRGYSPADFQRPETGVCTDPEKEGEEPPKPMATWAAPFTHQFEMSADDVRQLFGRTQFAISTEETRYYLNGVFFHTVDEGEGPYRRTELRGVATDGHRLSRISIDCPDGANGMPGVIVPRNAVGELLKLVGKSKEPVKVSLNVSRIQFSVGAAVLISKLVDGSFPDYARVIPSGNDRRLTVETKHLHDVVKRVSAMSSERGRAVKLAIDGDTGKVIVSVSNPDAGVIKDYTDCLFDSKEPHLEIGFNAKYLMDILAEVDHDETVIKLADSGSPVLIHKPGDGYGALFVLMPMRV